MDYTLGDYNEILILDGDDMARLPVVIEAVPDALDLVVPRDGPYG